MKTPKPPRPLTLADTGMILRLFDPASRQSARDLIEQSSDPAPTGFRLSAADSIEANLVVHLRAFISKLHTSGRGLQAQEFAAAISLHETAENIMKLLRLSEGSDLSAHTAIELANDLDNAWSRFAADATGSQVYEKSLRTLEILDKSRRSFNQKQRAEADAVTLSRFSEWQSQRRKTLMRDNEPLPPIERVRRYKRSRRSMPDREARRLSRLLKAGRIPPL